MNSYSNVLGNTFAQNNEIEKLVEIISKLPGLGKRSGRRLALHLIRNREKIMLPLADSLKETAEKIVQCKKCGNLDVYNPCSVCADETRDKTLICVVEDLPDLWAMERSHCYKGSYHVLGGTLSAIDGRTPSDIRLDELYKRVIQDGVIEVIIATNSTVEGQATAHYITNMLSELTVKITRLAQGIPMGGELDYLDEGTLSAALSSRKEF